MKDFITRLLILGLEELWCRPVQGETLGTVLVPPYVFIYLFGLHLPAKRSHKVQIQFNLSIVTDSLVWDKSH